jgi:hypothetical protein
MKTTEEHIKDAIEHLAKASHCMDAAIDAAPEKNRDDIRNLLVFKHVSEMKLPFIGWTMYGAMIMPNVLAYYLETSVLGKTYPE